MGHEHHGLAVLLPEIEQQFAHDEAGLCIQRTEGLVHQQDFRLADQHLSEGHALLLATGELVRIAIPEGAQTNLREHLAGAGQSLGAGNAGDLKADRHIVLRRLPRHQRILLEEIASLGVEARELLAENVALAAGRRHEACGDVEKRGFSATRGAKQRHEFAVAHREIDRLDRLVSPAPGQCIGHGYAGQLHGLRHASSRPAFSGCGPVLGIPS